MRLALEALVRYSNRLNEALFLTLEESQEVVVLREELIVGGSGSVRQSTELAIGVAFRMLSTFLGPEWRPRRVCFAHDAPGDRSIHKRIFGLHVEFGHDFNGIVCARADLDVVNPDADPVVARLARQMLEANPASTPPNMTVRVRELVVMLIGTGTARSIVLPSTWASTANGSSPPWRMGCHLFRTGRAVRLGLAGVRQDPHRSLARFRCLVSRRQAVPRGTASSR